MLNVLELRVGEWKLYCRVRFLEGAGGGWESSEYLGFVVERTPVGKRVYGSWIYK